MSSTPDLFDLTGKTALVTGASRGIGRAVALGLAAAGADVAVLARTTTRLEELAGRIERQGRRALVLTCDVGDGEQVGRAATTTLAEFGGLDIVVNNAGGAGHAGPFLDLEFDDWLHVLRLNLESTIHVCRAFGRHLVERGGGSVINMSSVAGMAGMPMLAHYAVAKAAVISLTRTLAAEWASAGVRVNAVAPGWVRTDLTTAFFADPAVSDGLRAAVPSRAFGNPEDVVGAAVYLAGDASRMVTGSCLVADGGTTCFVGGPQMLDLLGYGRIPV
ncbi:NAD(P)-dependent dehydrogenase (short-subunit alcohol dehydrogenase family) [Saccharothrix tamanrassetensis]|uniref:NAD(P)-dependent dehydrogenase (Short-subunit alcohol dehydrogenase family) n=1 Tax=Saccharothrix tamanrassetensis TaxID=1051531 RepID=A0A841CNS0_9PSEU|nr:SDR family NAD(P)-dependent oxidoreductase [Saccharothrix tamanrassetensis]MBB5957176.1 NAD(P)-dependent dehydrogenase (short-subunit alcohol dehydrogenase family) [Saccharothrix tamanrassetensis]